MAKSTYYFEINKVDVVKFRNAELMVEIKNIYERNKGRYGVRRVHKELVNRGYDVNHKRVQLLMHEMKLFGKRWGNYMNILKRLLLCNEFDFENCKRTIKP